MTGSVQFNSTLSNSLTSIEQQLQHSLQPVSPDQSFADTLRNRLIFPGSIRLEDEETNSNVIWLALGLVLGAVGLALSWHLLQRNRSV